VPVPPPEEPADAGDSPPEQLDVAALAAQLREELRRVGPRHRSGSAASAVRVDARAAADRVWPVSVDRHLGGRGGAVGAAYRPLKLALRRLMRWYVEPAFADQRVYNDAVLRLVDDLYEEHDRLRAELAALRAERP
jgi:hypothetical protein